MSGECIRTGMCCQRIPLPVSPRQLREAYQHWLRYAGVRLDAHILRRDEGRSLPVIAKDRMSSRNNRKH